MIWHYVLNNERRGPVEQPELDRLLREGVINNTTLVWHEGMANWEAYGAQVPAATPVAVAASGVVCAECGQVFDRSEVIRLGSRNICAPCKPRALQRLQEGMTESGAAEQIRQEHIKHEASVKSIGLLYLLGASLMLLGSFGLLAVPLNMAGRGGAGTTGTELGVGVFFLVFSAALFWLGLSVRKLKRWARICSALLAGIGLLGFPIGTLINGYILYLLFSKKGEMVFSPEYQQVIKDTPQIKYRTSIVVWIFVGLLLVLLAGGILAIVLSPTR